MDTPQLLLNQDPKLVEYLLRVPRKDLVAYVQSDDLFPASTVTERQRTEVFNWLRYEKQRRRRNLLLRRAHKKLWVELMAPLKRELANARVGAVYKPAHPDPKRDEAFAAYVKCLEVLLQKLQQAYRLEAHKTDDDEDTPPLTPAGLAKLRGLENNGVHWTDWVPFKVKDAVTKAFNELPYTPKAKRKVPFKRTVPAAQHAQGRRRLAAQIKRLMDKAVTEGDMDNLQALREAEERLNTLKENEVVPPSWRML